MRQVMKRCAAVARKAGGGALMLVPGFFALAAQAAEPRVPYVPTPQEVVERMLEIAKVASSDYLIDLGSGDGRIVVTAAKKYGTRGFGVDINPERIREANENAKAAGVLDKVAFYQRDLFATDLSNASVITMYLLPRVNLELRPKLLDLKPGTRIVSHDFSMEDWKPDAHVKMQVKEKYGASGGTSDIYFWVIPAKIAGTWQWDLAIGGKSYPYQASLAQKFQEITGAAKAASGEARLQNARLRGERIRFSFTAPVDGQPVKYEFSGTVDGDTITGTARLTGAKIQARLDWTARRTGRGAALVSPSHLALLHVAH